MAGVCRVWSPSLEGEASVSHPGPLGLVWRVSLEDLGPKQLWGELSGRDGELVGLGLGCESEEHRLGVSDPTPGQGLPASLLQMDTPGKEPPRRPLP